MRTYILLCLLALQGFNCNGQKDDTKRLELKNSESVQSEQPQGSWKVNKEFDEHGNLIRYDSMYSWSSHNDLKNFSSMEKDSLLQSFKSRFFSNFSEFQDEGFEAFFSQDSLFSQWFFNDDFFESNFGSDFMDRDSIAQNMLARQRQFLKKHQSQFIRSEKKKFTEPKENQ